ncbi:MAG: hypothetical protein Q4E55_06880 [Bacteroidales bacterium]|nr:hypothetical protein [Bacteroidales bacterium]
MLKVKVYALADIKALEQWFKGQTLPQSMQINPSAFSPDLKTTVENLFEQAYAMGENPKLQGALYRIEEIKAKLEANNEPSNMKS